MLEITVGVAVVLVVLAVPRLRSALLSLMGLAAIIAAGSAVIGLVVWGLYQYKPWLTPGDPALAEDAAAPAKEASAASPSAEADLSSAIASEEAQQQAEQQAEQQRTLDKEKLRVASLVGRARYILEEDRKFAAHAALNPLPAGVSASFSNIIAIRIPAWRDEALAERDSDAIRTWLRSIGLSADETASITTAKAWGSLYDMWNAERQAAAASALPAPGPTVSTDASSTTATPGSEAVPEPEIATESEPDPAPAPPPDIAPAAAPALPPIARQAPPRQRVRPPPPSRAETPRRPPPRRRPAADRAVGPFGY